MTLIKIEWTTRGGFLQEREVIVKIQPYFSYIDIRHVYIVYTICYHSILWPSFQAHESQSLITVHVTCDSYCVGLLSCVTLHTLFVGGILPSNHWKYNSFWYPHSWCLHLLIKAIYSKGTLHPIYGWIFSISDINHLPNLSMTYIPWSPKNSTFNWAMSNKSIT